MMVLRTISCQCMYIFLLTCSTFISAQKTTTKEYQVKAAFLFNFTHFVEWPKTSFATAQSPLVIGVLGVNPFGNYLNEITAGENVNGHPLVVQYYNNTEDIQTCHVLFINQPDPDKLEAIVKSLKGHPILTVSDHSDANRQEEVIRFFIANNKIQFQINPEAAKEANLIISSKLLNLSNIYVFQKNNN